MQRLAPVLLGLLFAPLAQITLAQVALAAPTHAAPASDAASVKAGDLAIETPWMRATPAGAEVAAGYVRITNTGTQPDRLVSAAIPLASTTSIHSMTMDGGVMRMVPVPGGLAIEPGKTVELKPGGYHVMFEGLKAAPKAGERVQGTLVFERAGTVPVTFTVAPIGAMAPTGANAAPMSGEHHH